MRAARFRGTRSDRLQQYTAPHPATARAARNAHAPLTDALQLRRPPARRARRAGARAPYAPVMPISVSTPSSWATRITFGWAFTTSKPFSRSAA